MVFTIFYIKEETEKTFAEIVKKDISYLRVNFTEDLTEDKRKIVKTWLERAKEKNNKEPQTCGDCEENQIRDFI